MRSIMSPLQPSDQALTFCLNTEPQLQIIFTDVHVHCWPHLRGATLTVDDGGAEGSDIVDV